MIKSSHFVFPLAAIGCVMAGASTGFAAHLWGSQVTSWVGGWRSHTTCAVKDEVFLPSERFGDFREVIDASLDESPYFGSADFPLRKGYLHGRVRGAIAAAAFRGEYQKAAAQRARALGYSPGDTPLLPLSGAVVADNPGVLEVFQAINVFASQEEAALAMAVSRAASQTHVTQEGSVGAADDSFVLEEQAADEGLQGRTVVFARLGSVVLSLTLSGGDSISGVDAVTQADEALTRLARTCGTG